MLETRRWAMCTLWQYPAEMCMLVPEGCRMFLADGWQDCVGCRCAWRDLAGGGVGAHVKLEMWLPVASNRCWWELVDEESYSASLRPGVLWWMGWLELVYWPGAQRAQTRPGGGGGGRRAGVT